MEDPFDPALHCDDLVVVIGGAGARDIRNRLMASIGNIHQLTDQLTGKPSEMPKVRALSTPEDKPPPKDVPGTGQQLGGIPFKGG